MFKSRKIIALDIGGVCLTLQFDKCFEALNLRDGTTEKAAFLDNCIVLGNGEISEDLWLEKSFLILDGRIPRKRIREAWEMVMGPEIPGTAEFVRALAMHGYEFAFLSDTSSIHMKKFRAACSFWELSSGAVLSYEVGRHKPDAAMYEAFEERFGVPLLYLDDLQENVDAASARGWNSRLFRESLEIMNLLNIRS